MTRPNPENTASAPAAEITASAFAAVDMRIGRVVAVEAFPQARNPAWKLRIDLGALGTRHTSAQLTRYPREQLLGRLIVVAVNLGTRRIAGFTSECLVLASLDAVGSPHLLTVDTGARPGDRIA